MGTNRTDYVLIGIRLDPKGDGIKYDAYEDLVDNSYDEAYGGPGSPMKMVFDGMNGQYVYFGQILSKALDDGEGFGLSIGTALPAMWAQDVKKEIERLKIPNPREMQPALHIFSHWH